MGMFSFMTQDTERPVYVHGPKQTITMVYKDREGNVKVAKESDYEGYGVFGGVDFYDAFMWMNWDFFIEHYGREPNPVKLRDDGITLYYDAQRRTFDPKFANVVYPQLFEREIRFPESADFSERIKDDPDQGWFPSSDEDEDEDFDD